MSKAKRVSRDLVIKRRVFRLSASSPKEVNLSATTGSDWLRGEYYLGATEKDNLPGNGQTCVVLVYPTTKGKPVPVLLTNRDGNLFEAQAQGKSDVSVIRMSPQDDGTVYYTPFWVALGDYGPPITPAEVFRLMREGAIVEIALNDPGDEMSHWEARTGTFTKV